MKVSHRLLQSALQRSRGVLAKVIVVALVKRLQQLANLSI
jgi:hypothetical protein